MPREPVIPSPSPSDFLDNPSHAGVETDAQRVVIERNRTRVFDVRDFGAVGDGIADDTTPIQEAMDEARAAGGGIVLFASGSTYKHGEMQWHSSSFLKGGRGNVENPSHGPRLLYDGPDGGVAWTLDDSPSSHTHPRAENLRFDGGSTLTPKAAHLLVSKQRMDSGADLSSCWWQGAQSDAIVLEEGATNFYMRHFRGDGIRGSLIRSEVTGVDIYGLSDFTLDNGVAGTPGGSLLRFVAASGSSARIHLASARLEVNQPIADSPPALIYLDGDDTHPGVVQFEVLLSTVWIPAPTAVGPFSLIHQTPATKDQTEVVAINTFPREFTSLITGTLTPGPAPGTKHPVVVFAPFTSGTPGAQNQSTWLGGNVHFHGFQTLEELSTTPGLALASGSQARLYLKDDKLIFAFQDGGTTRYKYLDLSGTGTSWVHTTTAP